MTELRYYELREAGPAITIKDVDWALNFKPRMSQLQASVFVALKQWRYWQEIA